MSDGRTIAERSVAELLHELRTASRLLASYTRTERDRGNEGQADAIQRHNNRIGSLIRKCSPSHCP
jgi:hypothetical protein